MKFLIAVFITFISVLNCNIAFSQEVNIAVVDLDRALRTSNYAQKQYKKLQADKNYKQLIDKINSIRSEIESMTKEGETKSLTWSEEQKKAHLQKGQSKVNEINGLASQEASVRSQLDARIQRELAPKLEEIVNDIIEEKSITVLLKAQAVHFYKPSTDLTEEILKRLNSGE